MKVLLVEATLKRFARKADHSVTLTFETMREMTADEFGLVDQYYQQNGHLAFKIDEIDMSDIPDTNTEIQGQRSDSQYLRSCLYSKHMNSGGTKETFPAYYHKAMQGFASAVNDSNEGYHDGEA